jgi:hypothetical protein
MYRHGCSPFLGRLVFGGLLMRASNHHVPMTVFSFASLLTKASALGKVLGGVASVQVHNVRALISFV